MIKKVFILFCLILLSLINSDEICNANEISQYHEILKLRSDDHYIGRKDAKIVIIEYSSLSCPHCSEFHKKTYESFRKNYIDTGKVMYIYRDFPTNKPAILGSMLAHCAGDFEYLNYINTLMNSQALWAYRNDYENSLKNIARLGGISNEKVKECFENKELEDKILKRAMLDSQSLKLTATPTFFIDGKMHSGIITYDSLSQILDGLYALKN